MAKEEKMSSRSMLPAGPGRDFCRVRVAFEIKRIKGSARL